MHLSFRLKCIRVCLGNREMTIAVVHWRKRRKNKNAKILDYSSGAFLGKWRPAGYQY